MEPANFFVLISALVFVAGAVIFIATRNAYRHGVSDGFGFANEPWNVQYKEAGRVLSETAIDRWADKMPRPRDEDEHVCSDCREGGCTTHCVCWCHGIQKY